MSTNINPNALKTFIMEKVGASMTQKEAQQLGVEKEYSAAAEEVDVNELNLEDIIQDNDLYAQFATMYTEEQGKDTAAAKDDEAKKKEQTQVKDKNGAGV